MTVQTHAARIEEVRAAFDHAAARFLARFDTTTDDEAVAVPAGGGWTAAQIAAHVAALNTILAGIVSGRIDRATPAPAGFVERPWADVASELAGPLVAPPSVTPDVTVTRDAARRALTSSCEVVLETFAALDEARASLVFTDRRTGTISLYQIGEWLTAHVARHNAQLKARLGR